VAQAKTLILRFSDFEHPTIALHDEVLEQHGQVWWGWWRKTHEPQRLDVLEAVKDRLPAETFGLVDRRTEKFYRARCVGMEIAPEDEKIPTPDPQRTPAYYRDSPKAAWFQFQEIKEISEAEWNGLFGDFGEPTGDVSLLWINEDEEKPAGPEFATPIYEATMPGEAILHLSDLHYGDDHGFPETGRIEHPTMREIIRDAVREGDQRIGMLVISGDLTTNSDLHVLSTIALQEIKGLAEDLELSLDNVVVTPGNHDIKLLEADPESYAHELGYRTFLDELFGEGNREPEAVFAFETPEGRRLNVATLNSVRLSNRKTKEYGYVGPRSKHVLRRLAEVHGSSDSATLISEGVLNMVVLHHHLFSGSLLTDPPEKRPVSVTLDAGKIIAQAQKAAVHVALHGHEHIPLLGAVARQDPLNTAGWDGYRRPICVIGGGSAGAEIGRLSKPMRDNTFGIYTPTNGGLEVTMDRFNQDAPPSRFLETTVDFPNQPSAG
jgi:3',5'-cyclic AMP phosphodiesterase CpdA